MANMGSLFPKSFGSESSNRAPKRRRQEQGKGEPRRRQRGSAEGQCGASTVPRGARKGSTRSNWADPAWRKQEVARRREAKVRPPAVDNPFAGYAAAGVARGAQSRDISGAQLLPLGADQRLVMAAVTERGANVFFTGNAGTGKSYLLRAVVAELNRIHNCTGVFVTASTGIAAANVGGTTLHSFAGIGLGEDDAGTMARTLKHKARRRWCDAKVLIIDEISMLDGRLLDKLDSLARNVRNRPDEPFGGIQLILVGDFFQLPPVRLGQDPRVRFCFAAQCWEELVHETFVLWHVYRQRDAGFLSMLDEVRHGTVGPASQALLEQAHAQAASRNPKDWDNDEIKPTRLYSTNRDVDALNERELSQLSGACRMYEARDQGQGSALRHLQQNCLAPALLQLKVGAQVVSVCLSFAPCLEFSRLAFVHSTTGASGSR
jgi:ATP-dependent DNA helicase PIF1